MANGAGAAYKGRVEMISQSPYTFVINIFGWDNSRVTVSQTDGGHVVRSDIMTTSITCRKPLDPTTGKLIADSSPARGSGESSKGREHLVECPRIGDGLAEKENHDERADDEHRQQ